MNKQLSIYCLSLLIFLTVPAANAGTLNVFTTGANGFDTHTFWYDDGKEITIIDTQFVPELATQAIQDIRSKSNNPITRVIITHPNPDKFNGLSALHKIGATSIASQATADAMPGVHQYKKYFFVNIAKKFTEDSYPTFEAIQQTFNGRTQISLKSGENITLFELKNPGISSTQTVVRIDATGDLLVGDMIHHQAHAWLEGGIVAGKPQPDLSTWQRALDELTTIKGVKRVYGGRGEFTDLKTAVTAQKKYLTAVQDITSNYIKNLGDNKGELFDAATAATHHLKLKQLISDAFPDYKLSYMTKYSIYGLAQKLASDS